MQTPSPPKSIQFDALRGDTVDATQFVLNMNNLSKIEIL